MRHLKRNKKLGRKGDHRNAMLANLAGSLIKHKRVTTTLQKAKAARPVVEKLVTLGRKAIGSTKEENVHLRRLAAAKLRQQPRSHFPGTPKVKGKVLREQWRESEDVVHILFDKIAPGFKERHGGYTRIVKMGQRQGDAAPLAILEFVESGAPAAEETAPAT
jgi:large subunit ribosomal protein L17